MFVVMKVKNDVYIQISYFIQLMHKYVNQCTNLGTSLIKLNETCFWVNMDKNGLQDWNFLCLYSYMLGNGCS